MASAALPGSAAAADTGLGPVAKPVGNAVTKVRAAVPPAPKAPPAAKAPAAPVQAPRSAVSAASGRSPPPEACRARRSGSGAHRTQAPRRGPSGGPRGGEAPAGRAGRDGQGG